MDAFSGAVERALRPEHAEFLVQLSAEAGWNQAAADWRFMLAHGMGFGMADETGRWVASALTLPVAPRLHWISMVLTAKTWRSRGIGTHLLRRCVETIRSTGAVAGLDATELGRPLYQRLGFADVYTLRRWQLDKAPRAVPAASGIHRQPLGTADIAAVAAYDKPRSAMERGATLAHLQNRAPHLAFVARSGANIVGFALGREGRTAHSIGPIVAENEHIACMLAAEAAAAAKGPVMLDVPERHAGMRRWLEVSGAVSPRGFTRMTLGEAPGLADSARVFASAGPELA